MYFAGIIKTLRRNSSDFLSFEILSWINVSIVDMSNDNEETF